MFGKNAILTHSTNTGFNERHFCFLQQSLVCNDSNDSSSVNYDSQSTTASVKYTYPSQLLVYQAGDNMRQLSTSLNNIAVSLHDTDELDI